jgi:hypothetical protein
MFDDWGSHVSVNGDSGNEASAESVFGGYAIVVDAIF